MRTNKVLRKKIFLDRVGFGPETGEAPLALNHPIFGSLFRQVPESRMYRIYFRFNRERGVKTMILWVKSPAGFNYFIEGNTLDEIFTQVRDSIQDWVERDNSRFRNWELNKVDIIKAHLQEKIWWWAEEFDPTLGPNLQCIRVSYSNGGVYVYNPEGWGRTIPWPHVSLTAIRKAVRREQNWYADYLRDQESGRR